MFQSIDLKIIANVQTQRHLDTTLINCMYYFNFVGNIIMNNTKILS